MGGGPPVATREAERVSPNVASNSEGSIMKIEQQAKIKTALVVNVFLTNSTYQQRFTPRHRRQKIVLMTHKCRGSIAVLSINKSVEPNEEQKVLAGRFAQGFTANTNRRIFMGFL